MKRFILKLKFHNNIKFIISLFCLYQGAVICALTQTLQEQAKIQYFLSMIEDDKVSFQQKLDFYDSTLTYYRNAQNIEMTREISTKKMQLAYKEGSYIETYKTGLNILNEQENTSSQLLSSKDSLQLNDIYYIMGRCCRNLGMFDESVKYFYSIIQQPYNKYTIESYSYLGFVFTQMRQMEKSKNFNDIAIKMLAEADSISVLTILSNVYNNLGGY